MGHAAVRWGVVRRSMLIALTSALVWSTLLAVVPSVAADDELPNEACLACHGTEGTADASGRVLSVIHGDVYEQTVHGAFSCTTCHTDVTELPHPTPPARVGIAPCTECHAEEVAAYQRSVHDGTPPAARCDDCHGDLHALVPTRESGSPTHWTHVPATCARCHANVEFMDGRVPVVRPVEAYLESVHGRAVQAGRRSAVCSDCHGAHDIARGTDPRSSIWRTNVPATCGACHKDILATYRASVHGQALAEGVREAPVCTDCHGEHRILAPTEPGSLVFAANIPGVTCGRCHGDARLNEKYGLSRRQVSAFRDSFHGLALRAGRLSVANCASCHGVHDILPASDPRSHVNPANLPQTCGKCHPGAGKEFALGSVHGDMGSPGSRAVAWIRLVYLWLIGLTIGGMAMHNALDLRRKALTPPPPPPPGAPVAERMTRALRWQHGLVMASFPVLVYTGFALTYPERWWAAPFVGFEGRWVLRGALHRAAAVVMVIGLGWHVAHVASNRRVRRCFRRLLPSPRDLAGLGGALAYYLGRQAHPPHNGTFNYAEKAEYWAFMWGSILMAVTGGLLWFHDATLQWLPGWVPDVATALHFYEAVLATLAILVWHLYWVIFDPLVYPMDWSWRTGRPPAARALERGPEAELEPEAEPQPERADD